MENIEKKFEEAKSLYQSVNQDQKYALEKLFPALKESEDERIRKELIDFVKSRLAGFPDCKRFIDWLEKQGEQKYADNIEPKFKVGDWCIDNEDGTIFQIVKVLDNTYTYKTNEHKEYSCTHYSLENDARLWTIQDAKDGDVLVYEGEIFMIKSYALWNKIVYHCCYDGKILHKHSVYDSWRREDFDKVHPATKEQRELLFQKIKQNHIQSVEEELTEFECMMLHIGQSFFGENAGLNPNDIKIVKEQANLLIGLIEHKSAWSEEDIKAFNRICAILVDASEVKNWWKEYRLIEREEMIRLTDFLKSLQHQPHWKPSEEQIDALKEAVYQLDGTEYSNGIDSLYNDLKNRIKLE